MWVLYHKQKLSLGSWWLEFWYQYLPRVIFPLISETSLPESAIAAIGIPQFATGPQKCVLKKIYLHLKKISMTYLCWSIVTLKNAKILKTWASNHSRPSSHSIISWSGSQQKSGLAIFCNKFNLPRQILSHFFVGQIINCAFGSHSGK